MFIFGGFRSYWGSYASLMATARSQSTAPSSQTSRWKSVPLQRSLQRSPWTVTLRTMPQRKRKCRVRAVVYHPWKMHPAEQHLSSLWKIHTTLIGMPALFSPQLFSSSIFCTGFIISFSECLIQACRNSSCHHPEAALPPHFCCSASRYWLDLIASDPTLCKTRIKIILGLQIDEKQSGLFSLLKGVIDLVWMDGSRHTLTDKKKVKTQKINSKCGCNLVCM